MRLLVVFGTKQRFTLNDFLFCFWNWYSFPIIIIMLFETNKNPTGMCVSVSVFTCYICLSDEILANMFSLSGNKRTSIGPNTKLKKTEYSDGNKVK